MPTLILKFKEESKGEFSLTRGDSLTIGRKSSNTVVIDNMAVSGTHAKVDVLEEGYLLTDLKSKNGTFVNGKIISSHWLQKGDVITIGKHQLVFEAAAGEDIPTHQEDTSDKTMVMDTNAYREMVDSSPSGAAPQTAKKKNIGILSFLKGGDGEVELVKKLTKIGKDDINEIVVSGLLVGKLAATVSRRPNGYYLNYVDGMAKPKVNGKAVKTSVLLKEFDKIEVGSATLEFIMKS